MLAILFPENKLHQLHRSPAPTEIVVFSAVQ